MKVETYLRNATREIFSPHTRTQVAEELDSCIEDFVEEFMKQGLSREEAEEKALAQMGNPKEISSQFYKIYKPTIDWREVAYLTVWTAAFGFLKLFCFRTMVSFPFNLISISFLVFGLIWSMVEKYSDTPFLYAYAENWGATGLGGLANACMFTGIGVGLYGNTVLEMILLALCAIIIIQVQRLVISNLRQKKEQRFLWETCTALKTFDFQSKVMFGEKKEKVRIKKGEKAEPGDQLIVVGIDGFTLLVEKILN